MAKESGQVELAEESQRNINSLVNEYVELSKISGLQTRMGRLKVEGYRPIKDIE